MELPLTMRADEKKGLAHDKHSCAKTGYPFYLMEGEMRKPVGLRITPWHRGGGSGILWFSS